MSDYRYRRQRAGAGPHRAPRHNAGRTRNSTPRHTSNRPRPSVAPLGAFDNPPVTDAQDEVALRRQREARSFPADRPRHRKPAPPLRRRVQRTKKHSGLLAASAAIIVALLALSFWPIDSTPPPPDDLEVNEVQADRSPVIAPAAAKEMAIPSIGVRAKFEDGACRVKDGAINPETMDLACTYTAKDKPYSLPGTNARDIVVIAGHTGAGVSAVFNKLYDGAADRHTVSVGDKLYIRTASSGDNWLVYAATDLHNPSKEGLSNDSSIWGEGAMPGRLLTISCIQPANPLQAAVKNAVIGWKYQGTSYSTE